MQKSKLVKTIKQSGRIMPIILIFFVVCGVFCVPSVLADVIIDNGDSGTLSTGTWSTSGATNYYGAESLWSRDGDTYTWQFGSEPSGAYEVLMWWTEWPSRSTSVPVDITHAGGTSRFYANQQQKGGQWNSVGEYVFTADAGHKVMVTSQPYPASTCADAVWFRYIGSQPAIIIDNRDAQTSKVGTWSASGATGQYAADSVWSRDGSTFSWLFTPPESGDYELSMWWTNWPSRSTSVPVEIENAGVTDTVIINQQEDGGQWNIIDTYHFNTGTTYKITVTSQPGPSSTCADAVKFDLLQSSNLPTAVIDSISPNPAELTDMISFVGHGEVAGGNITAYKWRLDLNGYLSDDPNFTYNAAVLGKGVYNIHFSVQNDANEWSDVVTDTLIIGNATPIAVIDSVTPNPAIVGQTVSFVGHGEDLDGTIKQYEWESSIDGILSSDASFDISSLSVGSHIISLRVIDDDDEESEVVTANLLVNPVPTEMIIDNRDGATSKTGTWAVSGGSGPYGVDSVWSRDGDTFSWLLKAPTTGYYDISMWWTNWPSRSTSVPVDIEYSGGTSRVYVNQQSNGSKWNSLGVYQLQGNTTYAIKVTSQPGPSSTCADAIKCTATSQPSVPVAQFTANQTSGARPLTVQFTDQSTGAVNQWLWDFGDGQTSNVKNPSHTYNSAGTYNVSLTATGASGADTETKPAYINVLASNTENIYLCATYSGGDEFIPNTTAMLRNIGATESGGVWQYQRAGVTYRMKFVTNPADMRAALTEQGSHVIIAGHANFGFGSTFADSKETLNQRIDDIYYVDDDRFVNYSTDMVSTKVDGMKYGQAYPNWEPKFKNGQSAIMPYTFAEGTPPYNYYLTYKIPGDPTAYKIELSNGKYLERFPDASTPVWYSPDGSPPDPIENPEYFIVNNDADYNRCDYVGSWPIKKIKDAGYTGAAGYLGYNFQVRWPGSGGNKAIWNLVVKYPGLYTVMATWYPDPTNATNAQYKITHAGGTAVVDANQQSSDFINVLGTYYFNAGAAKIELSDNANGQVVADAMVMSAVANPFKILQSEFDASVTSGSAPLDVQFTALNAYYSLSDPIGDVNQWNWDFGDGTTSTAKSPMHTYTAPGIYTVTLQVIDKSGGQATEIKNNLISVGTTTPLEAEFTSASRIGADRAVVTFKDQSSGNITGWLWSFGDGTTSTAQNPIHVYTEPGSYDVTLTVTNSNDSDTETEVGFVQNIIGLIYADNVDHTKPHFYSRSIGSPITFGKVICNTGDIKIPEDQLGYYRLFEGSCNSFPYYAGTFHRGIMFAKTTDVHVETYTATTYLEYYLKGYSDQEILQAVNAVENNHEYYNFNLKPPSMR